MCIRDRPSSPRASTRRRTPLPLGPWSSMALADSPGPPLILRRGPRAGRRVASAPATPGARPPNHLRPPRARGAA
eukprot:14783644-Alexandrium_andersonii.AAC.1